MENFHPVILYFSFALTMYRYVNLNAHAQIYCHAHPRGQIIMAALYSDSDYDEEFEDDYSPTRCVVPSYAQLYSLQLTAGGGAGDEDDGWNSDDESCKPVIPAMEEEEGV